MKLQGFITDSAQETALRGKFLRRLIEIVLPFTEGAVKALMDSYISKMTKSGIAPILLFPKFYVVHLEGEEFDYLSFKRFMNTCPNLQTRAFFNILMDLGLPILVKHLGLRKSRPDLARYASASLTPISFLMNNLMYR